MTKRICVLVFGLLLLAAGAWAARQDFTLVNRTGLTISELYVSSADVDEWEEDILGVDVLPDGESVDIHFAPKERAKVWDLMIVDEDGDQVVWQGLRLDKISKVTLRYDKKGNPVADLE